MQLREKKIRIMFSNAPNKKVEYFIRKWQILVRWSRTNVYDHLIEVEGERKVESEDKMAERKTKMGILKKNTAEFSKAMYTVPAGGTI